MDMLGMFHFETGPYYIIGVLFNEIPMTVDHLAGMNRREQIAQTGTYVRERRFFLAPILFYKMQFLKQIDKMK